MYRNLEFFLKFWSSYGYWKITKKHTILTLFIYIYYLYSRKKRLIETNDYMWQRVWDPCTRAVVGFRALAGRQAGRSCRGLSERPPLRVHQQRTRLLWWSCCAAILSKALSSADLLSLRVCGIAALHWQKKIWRSFFCVAFVSVVVLRQTGAPGASNACFFSPSSRPPFSSRLLGHRHHHPCCYLSLCVVCVLQRVAGDCEAWTQAAGVWSFYASLHSCEGTDISGSLKLIEVLGLGAEEKTVMWSRERGFWIFVEVSIRSSWSYIPCCSQSWRKVVFLSMKQFFGGVGCWRR
jgi:hypothetical protein